MIPLLVDTWPDCDLFRVVRPYNKGQAMKNKKQKDFFDRQVLQKP